VLLQDAQHVPTGLGRGGDPRRQHPQAFSAQLLILRLAQDLPEHPDLRRVLLRPERPHVEDELVGLGEGRARCGS